MQNTTAETNRRLQGQTSNGEVSGNRPLVSVVIPNCNGKHHLEKCLPSLSSQTYQNIELVLVDNGSTDDSISFTKTVFPAAKFVCNDRNYGFAKAVNQGVRRGSGEYLLILNNDTMLELDCVQLLAEAMLAWKRKAPEVIGLAPKILFSDQPVIDSIGNAVSRNGSAFNVGIGQVDLGQFDIPMRVIGLCFAAAFIERSAFDHVGFLDESYFAYYEDVDWCYRANIFGYSFYSEPKALVYHCHSGSARTLMTSDEKYYLIHRNFLRTMIKNYYRGNLIFAAYKLLNHAIDAYRYTFRLKLRKAWLHEKIIAATLLRLPVLLLKNVSITRRRVRPDPEIWQVLSSRIAQISPQTFDPGSYSPLITLDVVEEILAHLAHNVRRPGALEGYVGLHVLNSLRKQNIAGVSTHLAQKLLIFEPKEGTLRVRNFVAHKVGIMTFIRCKTRSYVTDDFLVNLALIMNGRTPDEVIDILLGKATIEQNGVRDGLQSLSNLANLLIVGLRAVATYLAKVNLFDANVYERPAYGADKDVNISSISLPTEDDERLRLKA